MWGSLGCITGEWITILPIDLHHLIDQHFWFDLLAKNNLGLGNCAITLLTLNLKQAYLLLFYREIIWGAVQLVRFCLVQRLYPS